MRRSDGYWCDGCKQFIYNLGHAPPEGIVMRLAKIDKDGVLEAPTRHFCDRTCGKFFDQDEAERTFTGLKLVTRRRDH